MSQGGDLLVTKDRDAMFIHNGPVRLLGMHVRLPGLLQSLPGELMPGLVILFLMGFRGAAMGVGGALVQLGSSLVILEMRSVVVTSGHLKAHDLPGLVVGFYGKLVSAIRVLQRSF